LIQVAFGADLLWKNHRVVLPAILASTVYLAAADVMAVSAGTWSFDPDSISGLRLGPLPLEEVLFFLVTNTLVVFSTTLLVSEESMARFRRLVGRARPSGSRTKATGSHPGRRARGGGESKMREVLDELRSVVLPRAQWFDAILPPVVLLAAWPLSDPYAAMIATCAAAGALGLFRAVRRESTTGAMIGVAGSAAAFVLWLRYGRVEAFFLPDLVTQSFLAAACLVSVVLRRPLVAWTSHVVRRWPRGWYWHARVRPAYMEVTLAWGAVFLLQTFLQWMLLQQRQVGWMAAAGVLNGTPATLVLLVVSYLYGTWRLRRLAGPSIAEFVTRAAPPWTGQRRGF
jgi:lycopene cyclase domain-containing protein